MKVLDLFCCQGMAGYGFHKAGHEVTGVDIEPQPRHWGEFIQADAIQYLIENGHKFDYIHASPPCQEYSMSSKQFRIAGKSYPDLISATREVLKACGKPWDIENVPEAPLNNPIVLCGTMFGLPFYRHRLFETNWGLQQPKHPTHTAKNAKMGRAVKPGEFIQFVGHFSGVQYVRDILGCQWADQYGLAQCVPPQYTEYIANEFYIKQII